METAFIVFKQTVVMFLYMFAGYVLFKSGKMTVKGSHDIANILIYLVIPVVIVDSFCVEFSYAKLIELVQSSLLGAGSILLSLIVASIVLKKDPVGNFGTAFSNAGFIGIPLVQAAFGTKGVFWIVGVVAVMNMMQWSYGVRIITGERSATSLKRLIINPILIGIAIGVVLFATGIGTMLPDVVSTTLHGIASLNAPVAMIVMGSYLAQSDMKKMFTTLHQYVVCFYRLILIPLITLAVMAFIPLDTDMLITIFITACAPAGANVAVYADLYDSDYPYACQIVALSTLLSIITMPLMLMIAGFVIK